MTMRMLQSLAVKMFTDVILDEDVEYEWKILSFPFVLANIVTN